ncbi:MAG: ShlB/FhaC/HecB family hemolysin secretion/activation protein [Magnetococcales bacterium]|nr:ShlB/FhaC/HecB family hemolysin secretion/activation protein [Magnetococcales bacterium]
MKDWHWVLVLLLMGPFANVNAGDGANRIPVSPPSGLFDYRSLGSSDGKKNEQYFTLPKELELFGNKKYLESLCVNFNGLSIDWSRWVNLSDKIEDADKGTQYEGKVMGVSILSKYFHDFFSSDSRFDEDKCRSLNKDNSVFVSDNIKASIKNQRLLLQFFNGTNPSSRWISLWSVTQFVRCVTHNYRRDGSIEESIKQCKLEPEDNADNFLTRALYPNDNGAPQYFLSRAFLPYQNLCGVKINPEGDPAKDDKVHKQIELCQTPELVRVELVEGRVNNIKISRINNNKDNKDNKDGAAVKDNKARLNSGTLFDFLGSKIPEPYTATTRIEGARGFFKGLCKKDYSDDEVEKNYKIYSIIVKEFKDITVDNDVITKIIKKALYNDKKPDKKDFADFCHVVGMMLDDDMFEKTNNIYCALVNNGLVEPDEAMDQFCARFNPAKDAISLKLENILKPLKGEEPLTRLELDRALVRASDLPGIHIEGTLKPPADAENKQERDTTDLDVDWTLQRWNFAVGRDNFGNKSLGPKMTWYRLDLNYVLTPGDVISWLFVNTSTKSQLRYNQLDYRLPFGDHGWFGRIGSTIDKANLGGIYQEYDVNTKNISWEVALGYSLQRDRHMKMIFEGGLHSGDANSTLLGANFTHDKVTNGFVKLDVEHHRLIQELGTTQDTEIPGTEDLVLTMKVAHGLRWNNHFTVANDTSSSRPDAGPDYSQLRMTLKGMREFQKISGDPGRFSMGDLVNSILPTTTTRLYASGEVAGQLSSQPLLSSEEMSFGGRMFGSSYDTGTIAGDNAIAFKGEIGYKWLNGYIIGTEIVDRPPVDHYELAPFGFMESALAWNRDSRDKELNIDYKNLNDGGVGLRFKLQPEYFRKLLGENKTFKVPFIHQFSAEGTYAWPMGGKNSSSEVHDRVFRFGLMLQAYIPEWH